MSARKIVDYFSRQADVKEYLHVMSSATNGYSSDDYQRLFDSSGFITFSEAISAIKNNLGELEKTLADEDEWKTFQQGMDVCLKNYKEKPNASDGTLIALYLYALCKESLKISGSSERLALHYGDSYFQKIVSGSKHKDGVNDIWVSYLTVTSPIIDEARKNKQIREAAEGALNFKFKNVEDRISQAEEIAKNIESKVVQGQSSQNFVNLSDGFDSLKSEISVRIDSLKKVEALLKKCIAGVVGFFILVEFAFQDHYASFPAMLLPGLLVAILIYYLRLTIREKSVEQDRHMDIENKLAIIAFIEHYVDFYSEREEKAQVVMESFNSLIFTPIYIAGNGCGNEPKLYDGFEQVAKIVKPKSPS